MTIELMALQDELLRALARLDALEAAVHDLTIERDGLLSLLKSAADDTNAATGYYQSTPVLIDLRRK